MKKITYILIVIILASCCFGNRKCELSDPLTALRIISATTGKDMVFGSSKIYDKAFIRFYSINGTDTIYHLFAAVPNSQSPPDSLLAVILDGSHQTIVYVKLIPSDIDTISATYNMISNGPCCSDYFTVTPTAYNKNPLNVTNGIFVVKK